MRKIIFLFSALFLFGSCAVKHISRIDTAKSYKLKKESFSINSQKKSISLDGEISIRHQKGNFDGNFEIFYKYPNNYRIMIRGPFNIEIASIIINNEGVFSFDKVWSEVEWSRVSYEIFGTQIPLETFSVLIGGASDFSGFCTAEEPKICEKAGVWYLFEKENPSEIKTGAVTIFKTENGWDGAGEKNSFSVVIEKREDYLFKDNSFFETKTNKGNDFEDL